MYKCIIGSSCVAEFIAQPPPELTCNPTNNRNITLMCSLSALINYTEDVTLVWMGYQKGNLLSFTGSQINEHNMINKSITIEQIYDSFNETATIYLWCQAFMSHLILLPPSQFITLQAVNNYKRLPQCLHGEEIAFPYQQCLFAYTRNTTVPTVRYQPIPAVRTIDNNVTNQFNSNSKCPGEDIAIIVLVQFFIFATLTTIGVIIGGIIIKRYIAHIRGTIYCLYLIMILH